MIACRLQFGNDLDFNSEMTYCALSGMLDSVTIYTQYILA